MIETISGGKMFRLSLADSDYVIGLFAGTYPGLYHWGDPIEPAPDAMDRLVVEPRGFGVTNRLPDGAPSRPFHLDRLPLELPGPLSGDFRSHSFAAEDGRRRPVMDPAFVSARSYRGLPEQDDLPRPRYESSSETETLEIILEDRVTGARFTLHYSTFPEFNVLTRSVSVTNRSDLPLSISRLDSFSLDFPVDATAAFLPGGGGRGALCGAGPLPSFDLLAFDGAWARERMPYRTRLGPGTSRIGSRRGVGGHASGPQCALLSPEATERTGEAYGFSLMYSGDWEFRFERSEEGTLRAQGGINPEFFSWSLAAGQTFRTPEMVLSRSGSGLNGLSRNLHGFVRERVCRGAWAARERPVLLNNWEATYFDFDSRRLAGLARGAADLGAELFVLDDGWFGLRNSDSAALGDWFPNLDKLPRGLGGVAEAARAEGLMFGLWIEPEMVSPDSDLFREHPGWALRAEGREAPTGRNQLVLDLTREDVRTEISARIRKAIASCRADYVKWDMNRPLCHALPAFRPDGTPMPPGEARHRQTLGTYSLMREITEAFPETLFEGCSGGGGRLDYGILAFMPQYWSSDDTDAIARLGIQYATSIFFPPVTTGAHVSACPNHQTGRTLPALSRALVAEGGNLGLELDPEALGTRDHDLVKREVSWYRENRGLLQFGEFSRLRSPWDGNEAAWMFSSPDRETAVVFWFRVLSQANPGAVRLRLDLLDPLARYSVRSVVHTMEETPEAAAMIAAAVGDIGPGRTFSGSELLARGLVFRPPMGDCAGLRIELRAARADQEG